ncbi:GNAT family N-acetyltransferase [Alkaliphilus serpentinus]|uniref:GNAT family N-acetyltransferase n=1 Tax=Alkaliphilus serpentinus TaxID=1482731 RepID=A0A833MDS6_9FIRM|nr:GNAT family protein [Alkaliphilus serpentinus]KAB3529405.1 GNAT family N-acetyltransferase [Alkaliphilus serpentinus]
MTEAVRILNEFSFDKLGLNRVQAIHMIGNVGSGRVMEKAGMKYEGLLRQYLYSKGKNYDVKMYSILKEDFKKDGE